MVVKVPFLSSLSDAFAFFINEISIRIIDISISTSFIGIFWRVALFSTLRKSCWTWNEWEEVSILFYSVNLNNSAKSHVTLLYIWKKTCICSLFASEKHGKYVIFMWENLKISHHKWGMLDFFYYGKFNVSYNKWPIRSLSTSEEHVTLQMRAQLVHVPRIRIVSSVTNIQ